MFQKKPQSKHSLSKGRVNKSSQTVKKVERLPLEKEQKRSKIVDSVLLSLVCEAVYAPSTGLSGIRFSK